MATNAADEVVRLQVQVTGASDAAASIAGMEREIAGAADGVRELEAQLKIMQSQKAVDIEQFRAVSGALDEQKAKLVEAQAAYTALGGSAIRAATVAKGGMEALEEAADKASESVEEAAETVQGVEAPAEQAKFSMDGLKSATNKLGGAMGPSAAAGLELYESLGKLGFVAGASLVAIAALAAIFAVFVLAVRKAGAASDAARSELLSLQGTMEGDAAAAGELQAAITAVSAASALGRDRVADYGRELAAAGLRGDQLRTALEAAAIAGSAGGDELAKSFLDQAKAAARAGQSVAALAAKIKAQYGGVAARQMLSLSVQSEKFKENIDALFAGANLEPFLTGLADMLSIFSQSTSTGRALRGVLSKAMSDFFAAASVVLPYAKAGFLGVLIAGLQIYIAVKRVTNALRDMVGPIGDLGGMKAALIAGKLAGYAILVVIVAIAAAVSLLLLPWVIFGVAIWAAYSAAVALWEGIKAGWEAVKSTIGEAVDAVLDFVESVLGAFSGIDLSTIASGMIDGLIEGITGSIGKVVSAVTDLASAAVSTMKSVLDSHSPSEVFREIGDVGIGGGLVAGMGDAEGDVETGVSDLVDPGAVKTETKAARSGAGGRPIVYIETLIVQGVDDFRARLAEEFEIAAASAQGAT